MFVFAHPRAADRGWRSTKWREFGVFRSEMAFRGALIRRRCWIGSEPRSKLTRPFGGVAVGSTLLIGLLVGTASGQTENPTPLTVVSAASYRSPVAPSSLVSIFGTRLASRTEAAALDSHGRLPTELAGTRVEINGAAASLVFVSPEQINCVAPSETSTGTAEVLVSAGLASRGSASVRAVAPALFTLDASGEGPGAILNAVTYSGEPFLVHTAEIQGDDQRTRLAVYGTGIRSAGEVAVTARDAGQRAFELEVEHVGAAPGFFGLDQVNTVLTAELDGAGVVSLTVTADSVLSNEATFLAGSLAPSEVRLDRLLLSRSTVRAGEDVTARVRLNGRAPAGGILVTLASDSAAAQTPAFVRVSAGEVEASFTVRAAPFGPTGVVTLTASVRSVTRAVELAVRSSDAADLIAVSLEPARVTGGGSVTGTVELSGPAPREGLQVALRSDSALAQVPDSLVVPFGRTRGEFSIATAPVRRTERATITAAFADVTRTAILEIAPLVELSLTPDSVVGGADVAATVRLGAPAPFGGLRVDISSNSRAARPPAFLSIAQGQTSVGFTLETAAVNAVEIVTLTASTRDGSGETTLTVRPSSSSTLEALSLSPEAVTGGGAATGTVSLTGPARFGGVTVSLRTDQPLVATAPLFVSVPAGMSSAQFTIRTFAVASTSDVTITASAGGVTRTATLTVN